MTTEEIRTALEERNKTICECERKLDQMRPAFLYENVEIDKWNNGLENALAQRDMLLDMLNGGDYDVK